MAAKIPQGFINRLSQRRCSLERDTLAACRTPCCGAAPPSPCASYRVRLASRLCAVIPCRALAMPRPPRDASRRLASRTASRAALRGTPRPGLQSAKHTWTVTISSARSSSHHGFCSQLVHKPQPSCLPSCLTYKSLCCFAAKAALLLRQPLSVVTAAAARGGSGTDRDLAVRKTNATIDKHVRSCAWPGEGSAARSAARRCAALLRRRVR
jgi:hypothetical protein